MDTSQLSLVPKYLVQDDLSQECIDLIPSLPRERGWVSTHLYNYQGFWHTPRQLQGVLTCQQNFQAEDSDIFLVTTPKSGTTWLKAIMFTLVNRNRYPAGTGKHPLLTNNPHELVPFLELKLYVDNQIPDLSSLTTPRMFATHLPIVSLPKSVQETKCKLVYLCRNPKDTFVSLWHFTNKIRPQHLGTNSLEEAFDWFCKGISLYGPFWDHVLNYWMESLRMPDKILFLKYEEMKEQPVVLIRRIAAFLGYPFSQDEEKKVVVDKISKLCSFDHLSNLEVNRNGKLPSGEENKAFFRQGTVSDWSNYLTDEMVEKLNEISVQKFREFGLQL